MSTAPVTSPTTLASATPVRGARYRDRARAWDVPLALGLLAVLVFASCRWLLGPGQVGGAQVGTYAIYYLVMLCLPGTLALKACVGTRGTWLEDLVLGTITGICLELGAWALFSLAGAQRWLWVWPLVTVVLLFPRTTRSRIMQRPTRIASLWTMITGTVVTLSLWSRSWWPTTQTQLPPSNVAPYPDMVWHLSLIHEATRGFPMRVPQLAEAGLLKYSWFFHASAGASALVTGLDIPTLYLRLWLGPMILLAVFAVGCLATRAAHGRALAGVVAMAIFGTIGFLPFWAYAIQSADWLPLNSPTMVFSIVVSTAGLTLAIDLLRRRPTVGLAILLVVFGVVSAGSKSSTMLLLTAGFLGTLVVSFFLRTRTRPLAVAGLGTIGLAVFAMALVTGGEGGTVLRPFSVLTLTYPFRQLHGNPGFDTGFNHATGIPRDLVVLPGIGVWLLIGTGLGLLVRMVSTLSFVLVPCFQKLRTDLVAWLLGGLQLAAWLPLLLMGHRGYSELYFIYGAVPFGAALWGWVATLLVRTTGQRICLVVCALLGLGVSKLAEHLSPQHLPWANAHGWRIRLQTFTWQLTVVVLVLVAVAVAARLLRRRLPALRPAALALALGACLGPFLTVPAVPQPPAAVRANAEHDRQAAGLWVSANVPNTDLMATNAACHTTVKCNVRDWWLSGIGGRRVLIEGWGYTPDGADGTLQHHRDLDLNTRAFSHPDRASIAALREAGVRWMVLEHAKRFPQPDLSAWGTVRYQNAAVTIYQLR